MAKKKTPKIDEKELSENLSNLGQMGEEFVRQPVLLAHSTPRQEGGQRCVEAG